MPQFISILLSILLFPFTILSSEATNRDHICSHHLIVSKPVKHDIPIDTTFDKRALQTYQNIRILFDYSAFTGVPVDYLNYIQNDVLLPVKNYFEATLKVKPTSKLTLSQSTICSGAITVPYNYTVAGGGVNADLVIFFTKSNDSTTSSTASGVACISEFKTNRPLFGRLNFNLARIKPATNNVDIEQDIAVTMHELTHILGFSNLLYDLYINPATNVELTGHYYKKTLNGLNYTILNLPPLTDRLRAYFNCSSIEGAYLENEEGLSIGTHFERRFFNNEYMTASTIKDLRITEFTLALLEGTGWYQVEYSMAEPMTFGKNKGCDFFNKTCVDTSSASYPARFEEFCSPLTAIGCSWTLRGGAFCGTTSPTTKSSLSAVLDYWGNKTVVSDSFSDNCPAYRLFSNTDCEDTADQAGSALKANESYGYGSKCFLGTLYPAPYSYSTPRSYCFKPTCQAQSSGGYVLKVAIGNTSVTCSAQGSISVSGYGGKLKCPDPTKFCTQIENEGYCKRKCSGRGFCVAKVCQCIDGWTHHDCSKRTYTDNCAVCTGKDPLRTSCYGDTCMCNPSNTTCMCELGLTTGSVCVKAPQIINSTGTTGTQNSSTTNTTTGVASNTTNSTQNITNGTTATGINGTNSTNNVTTSNGTTGNVTTNNGTSSTTNSAQNITNGTTATGINGTNSTFNVTTSNGTTGNVTTNNGTSSTTNSAQNITNGTIATGINGTNSTNNVTTSNGTTGNVTTNNGTSSTTNSAQNITNGTTATGINGTNYTANTTASNGTKNSGTIANITTNSGNTSTGATGNQTTSIGATGTGTTNTGTINNGTRNTTNSVQNVTNGTIATGINGTNSKNNGNTSTGTTGNQTTSTGTTNNGTISNGSMNTTTTNGNNNVKYTNSTSAGTYGSTINTNSSDGGDSENSNQAKENSLNLGIIIGGVVFIVICLTVFLVKKFAGTLFGVAKAAATKAKDVNFTAINSPAAGMSEIMTESPLHNQRPAVDTSQIYLQITQQDALNSPKDPQNKLILSFQK